MAMGNIVEDANFRLIEVNGQTILLEGDINHVSNEILEDMLTVKNEIIDADTVHDFSQINSYLSNNHTSKCKENQTLESWEIRTKKENYQTDKFEVLENESLIKKEPKVEENLTDVYHTEIAHLEDFQIPTAEDGTLLPATVNAKMADGSYQMVTLTPQIQDGNVTYTVQFSSEDVNINNCVNKNNISLLNKTSQNNEINTSLDKTDDMSTKLKNISAQIALNPDLPKQIESKISDLIQENDAVISSCKKIEYGVNRRENVGDVTKNNRKVKFKMTASDSNIENKKAKLSLLKNKLSDEVKKTPLQTVPIINLNSRLEYPILDNIDEPLSFNVSNPRNQQNNKFYNVVPPLEIINNNSTSVLNNTLSQNLEQYKNLMKLQRFLDEQDYSLKILPKKVKMIRPKQTVPPVPQVQEEVLTNGESNINITQIEQTPGSEQSDVNKDLFVNDENKNGILVKNNPIFFNNKIGKNDNVDNKFPLGSTENPIQLLQTGQVFHSRQPLSESQLKAIASILQKQSLEKDKKSSVFDPKTNTRIVYRVVYPDEVELKMSNGDEKDDKTDDGPKKRGRQKTKCVVSNDNDVKKVASGAVRGPGRPKLKKTEDEEDENIVEEGTKTVSKKVARTRSGRVSRPPRYFIKDYKRIHTTDPTETAVSYDSDGVYSDCPNEEQTNTDKDKTNVENNGVVLLPGLRPQQKGKRNVKPQYRCPTCQKIYLGYPKMMRHLVKFPDHCTVEKYEELCVRNKKGGNFSRRPYFSLTDTTTSIKKALTSMSKEEMLKACGSVFAEALTLWDFLLLRVNLMKQNGGGNEVNVLLDELSVLLDKLTKMAEEILFPVFTKTNEQDRNYVEIDKVEMSIALGLPTGLYKVNEKKLNLLRSPADGEEERQCETAETNTEDGDKTVVDPASFLNETWPEPVKEKVNYWNSKDVASKSPEPNLATKFEPNLSTKLLETSSESLEDTKFELIDIDSNSKDIEHSTSSENLDMMLMKKVDGGKTNENKIIDKTNSQLLDSLLSADRNTQHCFLTHGQDNKIPTKCKDNNFIDLWSENVTPSSRTNRLTSTPGYNETNCFNIPNRRNSISDFTNLDTKLILPPADTLIKKSESFSVDANTPSVTNDFINTEEGMNTSGGRRIEQTDPADDLLNISLDSLRHTDDVIVPNSSFEGISNILDPTPTNIFPASEPDGLDFNLSLPEHLLRTSSTSDSFITSNNNLFSSNNTIEQNFDYFLDNFVSETTNNFTQCFPALEQEFNDKKLIKKSNKKIVKKKKKKKIKKKKNDNKLSSQIDDRQSNFSLPINLDDVGNLDFLNQV